MTDFLFFFGELRSILSLNKCNMLKPENECVFFTKNVKIFSQLIYKVIIYINKLKNSQTMSKIPSKRLSPKPKAQSLAIKGKASQIDKKQLRKQSLKKKKRKTKHTLKAGKKCLHFCCLLTLSSTKKNVTIYLSKYELC